MIFEKDEILVLLMSHGKVLVDSSQTFTHSNIQKRESTLFCFSLQKIIFKQLNSSSNIEIFFLLKQNKKIIKLFSADFAR
jgi:hypothetical protein